MSFEHSEVASTTEPEAIGNTLLRVMPDYTQEELTAIADFLPEIDATA